MNESIVVQCSAVFVYIIHCHVVVAVVVRHPAEGRAGGHTGTNNVTTTTTATITSA